MTEALGLREPAGTADRLLAGDPSDCEWATAEFLNYVATTWEKQDVRLPQHAPAVARTAVCSLARQEGIGSCLSLRPPVARTVAVRPAGRNSR
ncbi:hypothetical protein ACWDBO_45200 [Streptomyces mirabilis]|uniref:hypothetical protein n=1 Tax=Streptomyces mirabilis TaxID=68239 RepID=UPI003333A7C1